MLVQQPWLQIGSLAFYRPTPHLLRMPDPITRLNAALEGRYAIERELGEGGMATVYLADDLRHEREGVCNDCVGEAILAQLGTQEPGE